MARELMQSRSDIENRVCNKCNIEKPLNQFYGRVIKHNEWLQVTFRSTCKNCMRPISAESVKKARIEDKIYARACKYWRTHNGIPSNLKLTDIKLMFECPCYYCKKRNAKISIILKDKTMGYTKNNVIPCCSECVSIHTKFLK